MSKSMAGLSLRRPLAFGVGLPAALPRPPVVADPGGAAAAELVLGVRAISVLPAAAVDIRAGSSKSWVGFCGRSGSDPRDCKQRSSRRTADHIVSDDRNNSND